MTIELAYSSDTALSCPNCGLVLSAELVHFESAFLGEQGVCPDCSHAFDLRTHIEKSIALFGTLGMALVFAGARQTVCNTSLMPGETKAVDLTALGVPESAEVLSLSFTPQGSGSWWPGLLTGNNALPQTLPPRFAIYARPGAAGDDSPGILSISALWFDTSRNDEAIRHLVEAAGHFSERRYQAMIVPAHIAVESSLSPVIAIWCESFAGKGRVKDLLKGAVTFGHQVNFLLPVAAFTVGAPQLPDTLRGDLNALRDHRNDLAHTGKCAAFDEHTAARLLTASIFAMRYAELLAEHIEQARGANLLPRFPGELVDRKYLARRVRERT